MALIILYPQSNFIGYSRPSFSLFSPSINLHINVPLGMSWHTLTPQTRLLIMHICSLMSRGCCATRFPQFSLHVQRLLHLNIIGHDTSISFSYSYLTLSGKYKLLKLVLAVRRQDPHFALFKQSSSQSQQHMLFEDSPSLKTHSNLGV